MTDKSVSFKQGDLRIAFINQQNKPVVKQLDNYKESNGKVTFSAAFPFDEFLLNGLTIAAVTSTGDNLNSANDVASKTLFGPGLIEL